MHMKRVATYLVEWSAFNTADMFGNIGQDERLESRLYIVLHMA